MLVRDLLCCASSCLLSENNDSPSKISIPEFKVKLTDWANLSKSKGDGACIETVVELILDSMKYENPILNLENKNLHSCPPIPDHVKILILNNNKIDTFSEYLLQSNTLEEIDLRSNQLSFVPPIESSSLLILNIGNNQLKESPDIKKSNIKKLFVDENQLTTIGNFSKDLEMLIARDNQINQVTDDMPDTMKFADFRNNPLTARPLTLDDNTRIMLSGTPLSLSIPKIAHYIWFGDKDLPKQAISNIIDCVAKNPDYQIKLWVDRPELVKKRIIERGYTSHFFSRVKIESPLFPPEVAAAIGRECVDTPLKNLAVASDIARLFVLYLEGGIYMDVDVALKNRLGEIRPQKESLIKEASFLAYIKRTGNGRVLTSNAIYAAPKNASGIHAMLQAALAPYLGKMPNREEDIETPLEKFTDTRRQEAKEKGQDENDYNLHNIYFFSKRLPIKRSADTSDDASKKQEKESMRYQVTRYTTGGATTLYYMKADLPNTKDNWQTRAIGNIDNFGHRIASQFPDQNTSLSQWQSGLDQKLSWAKAEIASDSSPKIVYAEV